MIEQTLEYVGAGYVLVVVGLAALLWWYGVKEPPRGKVIDPNVPFDPRVARFGSDDWSSHK